MRGKPSNYGLGALFGEPLIAGGRAYVVGVAFHAQLHIRALLQHLRDLAQQALGVWQDGRLARLEVNAVERDVQIC